jgi:hypothetical protein
MALRTGCLTVLLGESHLQAAVGEYINLVDGMGRPASRPTK